MGRPAKNGRFANFYISKDLLEQFETVVSIIGKTKTAVIEDILKEYVERFYDSDGKIHPVQAMYIREDKSCVVLRSMQVRGKQYYRIFYNGEFINVPERDIVIG